MNYDPEQDMRLERGVGFGRRQTEASVQAASKSEIGEQMSRMSDSLDLLTTVLSELDQRIAPVLCPPSPVAKSDDKVRCPESALAQSMQEQELKLRACIAYLMNIVERVRL